MLIYAVRHGETDANKSGLLQGWTDLDINESGVELAEITGRNMKGIRFDAAYSSPLKRAKHTADIILKESGNADVPVIIDERIKEVNMGEWEGRSVFPEKGELTVEELKMIFFDFFKFSGYPGGDSAKTLCARTQEFLSELAKKDHECVLVSTHGCAVRAMLNPFYEDRESFWHGHVPYNLAVNIIEVKDGKMKLIADDKIYYDQDKAVDRYAAFAKK